LAAELMLNVGFTALVVLVDRNMVLLTAGTAANHSKAEENAVESYEGNREQASQLMALLLYPGGLRRARVSG